ncbi:Glycosyltransferase involved in cell wall bisynthesis [Beijerinckiaceae bacterium RH AL1]|nr:glycosyltransferase [Beijerinckiaceae bacterium]VVB44155.1 Glycosyltransferase involved in cell wall bisynthesis [Beijerinckiaceae bacterium RH CH11]VVB44182.1 Glycosyltransferase involved in cell wall bisynthesis [Beijerinckiaceae bacterium RH AL8]VVC54197.1 Glycosyltransferase involved in cell wall bisynthesis [Beijerinckiaceae bacterium RH AL1]
MARKLLFYTHAFGGGGAEVVFARLATAFADAGDIAILAVDTADQPPPPSRSGLTTLVLPPGHAAGTRALAALLRAERPDASFSALGAQNLKHLAAAQLAGRARHCVLGYHGFAVAEPRRFARASFHFAALATRLAARTICVSDVLLDDMRRRWHASPTRTLRIYNPLPGDIVPCATAPREKLIVAIGRLVPVKRFPDLVAAFAQIGDSEARLAILGEGPERAAIEAAIARHGLEARVELPGHVGDLRQWYARAACVAIASESESFGLTAAEALAYGKPVVTTDCGGPPEILGHGKWGRVVPIGDAAAMADALRAALAAPSDPAPLVARAQTFALSTVRDAYAALADSLG